jgi:predicted TIM-barrel fold metal-dependent hydrolase
MAIIDSQIHCFYPDTPERPWPPGASPIHGPQFTIDQARDLMDRNSVDAAVLVPASWNGFDNDYSLDAAVAEPKRFGVVGRIDIQAGDAAQRLKTWRDQPGMLGVRVYLVGEPWVSLLKPEQDWFWQIAEETRLPVMTAIPGNMAGFQPVLQRHPELRLIIDHAGRRARGPKDEAAWDDLGELLGLAKYRNVSVKLSSLPCFSTQAYPFPNLRAPIKAMYETFGAERLHWGSDVTRLSCSYAENMTLFTEALDFLNERDREWVMSGAIAAALDWPL